MHNSDSNVIDLARVREQRRLGMEAALRERLRQQIECECYIQGFGLDDDAMAQEIQRRVELIRTPF